MQEPANELRRIPLLGTWVNKSKRKEQVSPRLQYLRPSLLGDLFLFGTYHHNRAVGVLDDAARDATHERPPYPALAPAAHNHQASAHLLGQRDDLVVRSSHLEVSLSDLSPAS